MKVLIVGAGPAGLYLAYLLKRQSPDDRIEVVEQNRADATFGFGVVFSDRALDFLRDDDAPTHALLLPAMQRWNDISLFHHGQRVTIDGIGFAAIGRLQLLQMLQQRLASVGVVPTYQCRVDDESMLDGHDLVVAADGANSFVRRSREREFGTVVEALHNRFAWYGTTHAFDTLSHTFIRTEHGCMNAHHYRYAPAVSAPGRPTGEARSAPRAGAGVSTFIVECDAATWQRAGFAHMSDEQSRAYNERAFADTLQGRPLIGNQSRWRQFPILHNARWSAGNRVLIGDALRTAHFSIGSGTRMAFEDAIALARALRAHRDDVSAALAAYECARRPIVDKLVQAANRSADWYEHFADHMRLEPWELAWRYIQRSDRVDAQRLRQVSPRFVAAYEDPALR